MDCKKSLAIFLNNSQDTGTLVDEIEKLKHYTKTANYVKYGRMTWVCINMSNIGALTKFSLHMLNAE